MVKKKSVKKKSMTKSSKKSHMECSTFSHCHEAWVRLGSMAFILFLITVWPAAMQLVHRIHWGWFLGAAVIFCSMHWMKHKCLCKMCR